jgi:RhoGEF, Guanine nucleotide exchange factor for Rho/Rac/Cdc42-like GTPases
MKKSLLVAGTVATMLGFGAVNASADDLTVDDGSSVDTSVSTDTGSDSNEVTLPSNSSADTSSSSAADSSSSAAVDDGTSTVAPSESGSESSAADSSSSGTDSSSSAADSSASESSSTSSSEDNQSGETTAPSETPDNTSASSNSDNSATVSNSVTGEQVNVPAQDVDSNGQLIHENPVPVADQENPLAPQVPDEVQGVPSVNAAVQDYNKTFEKTAQNYQTPEVAEAKKKVDEAVKAVLPATGVEKQAGMSGVALGLAAALGMTGIYRWRKTGYSKN